MACAESSAYPDQVKLRIKHTFIDLKCFDEDQGTSLRRQKSDPLFAYVAQDATKCTSSCGELCETPTTCDDCLTIASANDNTDDLITPASTGNAEDGDEIERPGKTFCFAGFTIDEPVIFDEPGFDSPDVFDMAPHARKTFSFSGFDMDDDVDPDAARIDEPGFESPDGIGMPTSEAQAFVDGDHEPISPSRPLQAGPGGWQPRSILWPEMLEAPAVLSTHQQLIPAGYRSSSMHPGDASSRVPLVPPSAPRDRGQYFAHTATPDALTLTNYYALQSQEVSGRNFGVVQFEEETPKSMQMVLSPPPAPPPLTPALDRNSSLYAMHSGAALEDAGPTTVMVRNLQEGLSQPALVDEINAAGYMGLFDFVYMPMNFRGRGNFGYAFVNFVSNDIAVRFMNEMHVLGDSDIADSQKWHIAWSTCQGFSANVERYRNSPLMHELVPKECKPALYDARGKQVPFPHPTKSIPKPRVHWPGPKDSAKSSGIMDHDSQLDMRSKGVQGPDSASNTVPESRRPGRSKNHQRQQQQGARGWRR